MTRGLALGCGGPVGLAWMLGMLSRVERELGWDAREADAIVGTSAGAELALCLGSGVAVADLVAAARGEPDADPVLAAHLRTDPGLLPPLPAPRLGARSLLRHGISGRVDTMAALAGLLPDGRGDSGWLAALADHLVPGGGWVEHSQAWMVAVDVACGERVAFGAPGAPPAAARDAVRASWAVPGWFPPQAIGGRRYLDGGVCSPVSADLLAGLDLDEVVVLTPMASRDGGRARGLARIERLSRRVMSRRAATEVRLLERAGVRVLLHDPDEADLRVMSPNFMDARRCPATLERAARPRR